jgi:ankyrin repeat protein
MARLNPDILALVRRHSKTGQRAPAYEVWSLLRVIVSEICSFTLVLDGFDEYDRTDNARAEFLQKLSKATDGTGSRILVTSRIETDIEAELSPKTTEETGHVRLQCKITEQDVRTDISMFCKSVVDKKLPRKDDRLRHEVAGRLAEKCEGMFLWIRLQQDQLRSGKNAKQLHSIVNNMPVGLHHTYERNWGAIQKLSTEDKERALAILEWTTYAFRPLTVAEITEALVVECNNDIASLQWDDLPDEIDEEYINSEIVDLCGGLIETRAAMPTSTARMRTVHLIHSSVREFLLHALSPRSLDIAKAWLSPTQPSAQAKQHDRLATVCIAYLDDEETWQRWKAQGDAKGKWGFVDYAAKNWDLHATAAEGNNANLVRLMKHFFRAENRSFDLWREFIDGYGSPPGAQQNESTASPLYYAALFNLPEVVEHILAQDVTQLDKVGGRYGTPLQAVCFKGHESIFKMLIDWGANANIEAGEFGVPINAAIHEGHQTIVKRLLDHGVNHTLRDPVGRTTLYMAAMNGNYEAICWMLGASADEGIPNNYDRTSLNAKKGADLTVSTNDGYTPLIAAASSSHLEVVRLLLKRGADFTIPNNDGWTPLNAAASNSYLEVVKLLLDKEADLTVSTNDGWTPLNAVASSSYLEVVRLLLEKGADLIVLTNNGWTLLNAAASSSYLEVVRLLLEKGADLIVLTNNG